MCINQFKSVIKDEIFPVFNPLKAKTNLNYFERSSPYRLVNTLRLGYKTSQSVYAV